MTVKECYERLGADFEDVFRRLKSEERVRKFLGMLLRDESFSSLCAALDGKDYEAAFRAAHTLKGVLMNLSLTPLAEAASDLTEALRGRQENEDIRPQFERLKKGYLEMQSAVSELVGK